MIDPGEEFGFFMSNQRIRALDQRSLPLLLMESTSFQGRVKKREPEIMTESFRLAASEVVQLQNA
jgi:hypothetical protein